MNEFSHRDHPSWWWPVGSDYTNAPTYKVDEDGRMDRRGSVDGPWISWWIFMISPVTSWIRQVAPAVLIGRREAKGQHRYRTWCREWHHFSICIHAPAAGLRDGRSSSLVSLPFSWPIDHHSSFLGWNKINQPTCLPIDTALSSSHPDCFIRLWPYHRHCWMTGLIRTDRLLVSLSVFPREIDNSKGELFHCSLFRNYQCFKKATSLVIFRMNITNGKLTTRLE